MGIFAQAGNAKVLGDRRRVSDYQGRHICKILECKMGEDRSTFFGVNFEVAQSGNPALANTSKVGWATVKHPSYPDYFYSDTKKLVGIVAGEDPETIGETEIDQACGISRDATGRVVATNPQAGVLNGRFVGVEVYLKNKRDKAGKPTGETVNAVRFFPVDFTG